MRNQSRVLPGYVYFFVAVLTVLVYASSTGITGRTNLSGGSGCSCHSVTPSGDVNVAISGPESLSVNTVGLYRVTINGGPLNSAGTNIAASSGSLNKVDGSLQVSNGELTHTSPKSPSSGSVVFEFELAAPAQTGTITLAATGNSVNLNGANSGDAWNHAADFNVTVVDPSAIAADHNPLPLAFNLEQNYPNPFNPKTRIAYTLDNNGFVLLQVYDITGRKIATLVSEAQGRGRYVVSFDGGNLPSGSYFYSLQTGEKRITKRMLLLK